MATADRRPATGDPATRRPASGVRPRSRAANSPYRENGSIGTRHTSTLKLDGELALPHNYGYACTIMRLSEQEIAHIKQIISDHFGPDARVRLFGSRVDDHRRGGDIDLLVESSLSAEEAFRAKVESLTDLHLVLGEQKIDLVICSVDDEDTPAVVETARRQGVQL